MPKRKVVIPVPEGLVLGTLVRYYKSGWYIGRFDAWVNGLAEIMPVGKGRHVKVSEANIEPIERIMAS
jgi:hypothetical protein